MTGLNITIRRTVKVVNNERSPTTVIHSLACKGVNSSDAIVALYKMDSWPCTDGVVVSTEPSSSDIMYLIQTAKVHHSHLFSNRIAHWLNCEVVLLDR